MRILFILALLATGTLGVIHIIAGSFSWLDVFAPVIFIAGLWLAIIIFRVLLALILVLVALIIVHRHSGATWTVAAERVRDRTLTGDPKHPINRLFHD